MPRREEANNICFCVVLCYKISKTIKKRNEQFLINIFQNQKINRHI